MRSLLCLTALALVSAPSFADTKTFNLSGFKKIEADSAFTIEFTQSPTYSIVVDSRHDNMDKIIVEKSGDTLRITRPNNTNIRHEIEDIVRISAPNLEAIKLHSAVKFTAEKLTTGDLDIDVHSATQVSIGALKAKRVDIDAHSAAQFELAGECDTLKVKMHSAAKLHAADLHCKDVSVDAGSASSASIWASEKAFAEAGVASKINVGGKPKSFEKKASEMARVTLVD
jgi:Putative auto-transporter adhesin, head GIN domain